MSTGAGTGAPYVEAVVVRCAAPTSARPGDRAIVRADGTIEGFVGGSCADATVRLQALRVMETGEPVLLRILPGEADGPGAEEGTVVVANPCLSGGALELFLEPHLPRPAVAIFGESPIAQALAELAAPLGFAPRLGAPAEPGDFACVVASLGHGDEEAVRRGLEAGCEYVGLVASRRRGAAVLAAMGDVAGADRVRTPAGLDIGARTHAEIALAILAELVAVRRTPAVVPVPVAASARVAAPVPATEAANPLCETPATNDADAPPGREPVDAVRGMTATIGADAATLREAVDPVCGMTVALGPGTPTAGDEAFCCEGCRDAWLSRAG